MGPFFLGFALSVFSLFLLFVNAILYASQLKKFKDSTYRYVTIYLIVLFLVEFPCNVIGYLNPDQNFYLSHFYFNAQFILLSIVFYRLFITKTNKRLVIVNYVIITTVIIGMYANDPQLIWQFNLFEITATSTVLIVYALIQLFNTLGKEKKFFYLSIGLMIYLLCSSLIFLSGNYELVFIEDPRIDIWIFNTLFYIVYQVLIFIEWRFINKHGFRDE